MTAKTTAEMFFKNFILHYGIPKRIHSDQGANFESRLMKELCTVLGMEKSRTTSYHPMGNGMVERFNRTLLGMLGTLQPDQKVDWKSHIAPLVHAYNSTRHESTNQSPFYLMFGRDPRLPIDLAFGIETNKGSTSLTAYSESLKQKMKEAYDLASKAASTAKDRQKAHYDLKVRGATVEKGDRVLVKILAFEGRHKLADRWEEDPYVVLLQPNKEIPVFVVQRESGEGKKRTLHRNHLLPIGSVPVPNDDQPATQARSKTPAPTEPAPGSTDPDIEDDTQEDESDEELRLFLVTDDTTTIGEETVEEEETSTSEAIDDDQASAEVDGEASGGDGHMQVDQEEDRTEVEPEEDQDLESTESSEEDTIPEPPAVVNRPEPAHIPRRTARERRKPAWQTSGQYVMSQVPDLDWQQKSRRLEQLAASGVLGHISSSISKAFLSLVDETPQ